MRLPILIAFWALTAHATALWDQSPPNFNSFNITDSRLADDFSLSQAVTLSGIDFWYQAQFEGLGRPRRNVSALRFS